MPLHPIVQSIMDRARAAGFTGYADLSVGAARAHYANTAQ